MDINELGKLKNEAKTAYEAWDTLRQEQFKDLEELEAANEKDLAEPEKAAGQALKAAKEAIQKAGETWKDWCAEADITKSTADRLIRELDPKKLEARRAKNREAMRNIRLHGSHKAPCGASEVDGGKKFVRIDDLSEDKQELITQLKDGDITDKDASLWRKALGDDSIYAKVCQDLEAAFPELQGATNAVDETELEKAREAKSTATAAKSQSAAEEAEAAA